MEYLIVIGPLLFWLVVIIVLKVKENFQIKEGENFTKSEKKALLRAFAHIFEEYKQHNDIFDCGLCNILRVHICRYSSYELYHRLCSLYHNPDYYNSQGLDTSEESCSPFWWQLSDIDSRLEALNILEQAIIND